MPSVTVGPAGGSPDYTSLNAALLGEQTDVVADQASFQIRIRTMTVTERFYVEWADGNETYNLTIEPDTGHHHLGVEFDGVIMATPAGQYAPSEVTCNYARIIGLNFNPTDSYRALLVDADDVTIAQTFFESGANSWEEYSQIYCTGNRLKIISCSFSGRATYAASLWVTQFGTDAEVIGSNFCDLNDSSCAFAGRSTDTTAALLKNNLIYLSGANSNTCQYQGSDTDPTVILTNSSNAFNAFETGHDDFGLTPITGLVDADFVDFAGGDYTPATSGNLYQSGDDLSASGGLYLQDITGATRSAWSAGAYDGEAATGGTITGSGSASAQSATVSGTAEREITTAGAMSAESATVAGVAERAIAASGALTSESSAVSGLAAISGNILAAGVLQAESATITGEGYREAVSFGVLIAQPPSISGAGEVVPAAIPRHIRPATLIYSQNSTISGSGGVA